MNQEDFIQPTKYRIQVKESLGPEFADWFLHLSLIPQEDGTTLLEGSTADYLPWREFLHHASGFEITVISIECTQEGNSDQVLPCQPPGRDESKSRRSIIH
jgi:hypothetical protein